MTKKTFDLKELVTIKLFKDGEKYNDDVFVSVNGCNYQIKRGETVKVPMFIKLQLDKAEEQRKKAEADR